MSADENKTPEQIESEIEETRAELGDTVAAAADKADVKKQAKKKTDEAKAQVKAKVEDLKEKVSEKAAETREQAGEIKHAASEAPAGQGPYAGTGGDIGSGPTGDLYQPVSSPAGHTALIAGTAAAVGFILGRLTARS